MKTKVFKFLLNVRSQLLPKFVAHLWSLPMTLSIKIAVNLRMYLMNLRDFAPTFSWSYGVNLDPCELRMQIPRVDGELRLKGSTGYFLGRP